MENFLTIFPHYGKFLSTAWKTLSPASNDRPRHPSPFVKFTSFAVGLLGCFLLVFRPGAALAERGGCLSALIRRAQRAHLQKNRRAIPHSNGSYACSPIAPLVSFTSTAPLSFTFQGFVVFAGGLFRRLRLPSGHRLLSNNSLVHGILYRRLDPRLQDTASRPNMPHQFRSAPGQPERLVYLPGRGRRVRRPNPGQIVQRPQVVRLEGQRLLQMFNGFLVPPINRTGKSKGAMRHRILRGHVQGMTK